MIVINKKKFLAELGKLLTFMEDEDRLRAVAMYSEMFDSFNDESALIKALMSPTKQAVLIARSYDRSSGDSSFAAVIDKIRQDAVASVKTEPIPAPEPEAPAPGPDLEADLEAENRAMDEESSEEAAGESEQAAQASSPESDSAQDEPCSEDAAEPAEEENNGVSEPAKKSAEPENEAPAAFAKAASAAEPALSVAAPAENVDVIELINGGKIGEPAPQTERKARVFLLILYTLVAIPLGIAGTCVLLVPAALFAALTATVGFACFALGAAVLSGFAVLADLFTVLGLAVMTLAASLLLLWIVIWLLFGAIPGWIRFLCAVGGAWCFKEVEING